MRVCQRENTSDFQQHIIFEIEQSCTSGKQTIPQKTNKKTIT